MEERDLFSETFETFLIAIERNKECQYNAEIARKDYESLKNSYQFPIRGKDLERHRKYKDNAGEEAKRAEASEESVRRLNEKLLADIREAGGPVIASLGIQEYTVWEDERELKWKKTK